MIIYIDSIEKNDDGWTFEWSDSVGVVFVILDGELLTETSSNTYTYPTTGSYSDEPPPIEISTEKYESKSSRNLPYLLLQWHRVDCEKYLIEFLQGSSWISFDVLPNDNAVEVFSYRTPLLVDQKQADWRITPIDSDKREGDPLQFRRFVVRPPDIPTDLEYGCSGGTFTVSG